MPDKGTFICPLKAIGVLRYGKYACQYCCRQSACGIQSSSVKTISSPSALRQPALRAAAGPFFTGNDIQVTATRPGYTFNQCFMYFTVCGSGPSVTIITSKRLSVIFWFTN